MKRDPIDSFIDIYVQALRDAKAHELIHAIFRGLVREDFGVVSGFGVGVVHTSSMVCSTNSILKRRSYSMIGRGRPAGVSFPVVTRA
jgi:hypothetical protein